MDQRDSEDVSLTILRHCVARGEGDLSPLQMRILHDPKPVRIFSAPTGAGKSYALVRAAAAGQRVLFVVPTRRLAQNLAAAAIKELSAPGMAPGGAESLVALWSSDETARLRAECPDVRIGRLRVRQTRELGSNARFIVATPESIAFMLLWALRPGYADLPFCLADLVVNFDHVVFDEFHTIDARGFGLCAVVARAVAAAGGAKLTFLSATPIDLLPVLSALGLPGEAVAVAAETVVTEAADSGSGLRAVHGDMEICFCSHLRILDLLETHAAALRECLLRGRQIVVILDSLDTLHVNKRDFAAFFDRLGVPAANRLAINSVDDSATPDVGGAFVTDRYADPLNFQVLLATSSVEMGVTFKAGVIVMDPGHDALSFVQRVGRVARGDEQGLVLVRYDAGATNRKQWLREILATLQQEPMPRALTVDRFLEIVLRATRQRFTTREKLDLDEPPRDFRTMPARAVWAAALFFHALERAQSTSHRGQREALESIRPAKVARIAALLRQVSVPIIDGDRNGVEWARAFLAQAATLRDFAATIMVKEPGGRCLTVPLRIINNRPEMAAEPVVVDQRGNWVMILDRPFDEALCHHEKVYREELVEVMLPDGDTRSVPRRGAATEAAQLMERCATRPGTPALRRKRFEAAATLVRLSGLVPPAKDIPALPTDASAVL